MDPLSDVLSLRKPRSYMSGGLMWVDSCPSSSPSTKYQMLNAGFWPVLAVRRGCSRARCRLETADSFVLPHGRPFRLASDL